MATDPNVGLNVTLSYNTEGITVPESAKYTAVVIDKDQVTPEGYESVTPSITKPLVLAPGLFTRQADQSETTDTISNYYDKNVAEQEYSISDSTYIVVDFTRTFSEQVRPTDDVLGEANIDDDQTAFVQKLFLGNYAADDSVNLTTTYIRSYQDSYGVSDADPTLDLNKLALDTGAASDSQVFANTKSVVDPIAASDAIGLATNKPLQDEYAYEDTQALYVYKGGILDEVQAVQEYFNTTVDFQRVIVEYVNPTDDVLGEANIDDDQTAFVNKGLIDVPVISEEFIPVVEYRKIYLTYANWSEDQTAQLDKPRYDALTATDTIEFFSVDKSVEDQVPHQDTVAVKVDTVLAPDSFSADDSQIVFLDRQADFDTFSTLDTVNRQTQFYRQYSDFVAPTDDVLGEADADDEQTAFVNKGLVNFYGLSDTVSTATQFNRNPDNTVVNSDLDYFTVEKALTETQSIAEDYSVVLDIQSVPQTAAISDNYYRVANFIRDFTETPNTVSDTVSVNVNLGVQDTVDAQETYFLPSLQYYTDPLEPLALQETVLLVTETTRQYLDSVTISDPKALSLGKPLTDAINSVTDVAVYKVQPSLQETVLTSETRTANIQDYVVPDYVEPGYVGSDLTL